MSLVLFNAPEWMHDLKAWHPGGYIDTATAAMRKAYGVRALERWRASVTAFANGQPITATLIEAHDRQSVLTYALCRAAGYASHEQRAPRASARPMLTLHKSTPSTHTARTKRKPTTREVRAAMALELVRPR